MSWKKATAAIVGVVVQFLPLDDVTKSRLTWLVVGYITGQGLADIGKEKAKVEADVRPLSPPLLPPPRG